MNHIKHLVRDVFLFQVVLVMLDLGAILMAVRAQHVDVPALVTAIVFSVIGLAWLAGWRVATVSHDLRLVRTGD